MTEDKKEKKDNFKEFTDAQKEELRKITQARRISKAPPPITPVRSYSGVALSRPQKPEPQKEFTLPITGNDLMKKWSKDFAWLFHCAREGYLCPYEPDSFKDRVRLDFAFLTHNVDERASYFSLWLYRKSAVEAFEKQYGHIIDEWRKNVVANEDEAPPQKEEPKAVKPVYLTAAQENKYTAREIAEKYILKCKGVPSIKKAVDMVKKSPPGKLYIDKTIRNWIKDLFPPESRKPGRRKKEQ